MKNEKKKKRKKREKIHYKKSDWEHDLRLKVVRKVFEDLKRILRRILKSSLVTLRGNQGQGRWRNRRRKETGRNEEEAERMRK